MGVNSRMLDQKQQNIFGRISLFWSVELQGHPEQLNGGATRSVSFVGESLGNQTTTSQTYAATMHKKTDRSWHTQTTSSHRNVDAGKAKCGVGFKKAARVIMPNGTLPLNWSTIFTTTYKRHPLEFEFTAGRPELTQEHVDLRWFCWRRRLQTFVFAVLRPTPQTPLNYERAWCIRVWWYHLQRGQICFIQEANDYNNIATSQTCRHDDDCVRQTLIACTYRSFVDQQSAVAHSQLPAPRYGTTCQLTSQLRRHSRSSDSALKHFCSRAHTLTLSLNL